MAVIPAHAQQLLVRPEFGNEEVSVGAGASLIYVFFIGDTQGSHSLIVRLAGDRATANILGFEIGNKHASSFTLDMIHESPRTTGRARLKSVLGGSAKSDVRGMIRVEKAAQGADGYFTHNTLLLSRDARGTTSPALEIEANEVKASHAATIHHFDADMLFYLGSRGIHEVCAKEMILTSFVSEYVGEIPDAAVRRDCEGLLQKKLRGFI